MFNGIGLQTPRGSGTSGHVQKNVAVKKNEGIREKRKREAADEHRRLIKAKMVEARRNAGGEVRNHDKKRKIEVKCMELRESLEDDELSDPEIDKRVAALRAKLLAEQSSLDEEKSVTEQPNGLAQDLAENGSPKVSVRSKVSDSEKKFDGKEPNAEDSSGIPYNYVPRYDNR